MVQEFTDSETYADECTSPGPQDKINIFLGLNECSILP